MDESGQNIQKPKRKRKITNAFALPHLQFATQGLDTRGFPSPPVIISALGLHLLLILALASIPPIDFKRDEILPVQIIEEEKPPPPPPIIEKQEIPKPIEKIIPKPKEIIKPIEKEQPKPIEKQEEIEPAPIKMPEIKKLEVDIKKLKLQPNQNIEDQIKLKNIDIKAPPIQEIENIPQPLPALHKVQINKPNLDNKNINTNQIQLNKQPANDINLKKIDDNIPIDAPIMPNNDLKKIQEETLKRQQELEALAKQNEASKKPASNAPPAPNGELAKPSGVTSVGANNPPAGGQIPAGNTNPPQQNAGFGDGTLPKRPPTYGSKGRNIFEDGTSDGSLIGRVGASFDCAKLGVKERQEKCPNWSPLEARHKNIDPMIPQGVKKYNGPQNPLPPCPPGSPNSNLGLSCLPSKTPLNRNQ